MAGLQMKYFVLKPSGGSPYARASRRVMQVYALAIREENAELATEIDEWVNHCENERRAVKGLREQAGERGVAMKSPIRVELEYPRLDGKPDTIEIALIDVRASDGIQIKYDFERDGWVVLQPKVTEWEGEAAIECDEQWTETAFVQSWNLSNGEDGGKDERV